MQHATFSTASPSTTLHRQISNARTCLVANGSSQRTADDVMRATLTQWLADNAVGSLDGLEAEFQIAALALQEAFARRGYAPGKTAPPVIEAPPPWEFQAAGWTPLRVDLLVAAAALVLLLVAVGVKW